jgi:drug/metabolite transporter (DMT)-like permease
MKTFLALAAACFLGIGFVAQQHVAYREPLDEMLRLRLLTHLIRQPVWLLGIAAMVCGQVLGAVALDESDLGRVEPLLATNLIFALVIAHLVYKEPLSREVWWGGLLVTGGVVIFLAFGQPHGGRPTGPDSPRWLVAGVVVLIAAGLVLAAIPRSLRTKAMLFAAAAGMLFGVQDALTRGSLLELGQGMAVALHSWQPYALIVIAVLSLLLAESAFDAAPIGISLPAITAVEPIVGIILGIFVFAEHLGLSEAAIAAEVIGLLMIVTGIGVLGRSSFLGKPAQDAGTKQERESR